MDKTQASILAFMCGMFVTVILTVLLTGINNNLKNNNKYQRISVARESMIIIECQSNAKFKTVYVTNY